MWLLVGFYLRMRIRTKKFKQTSVADKHKAYLRHSIAMNTMLYFDEATV